MGVTSPLRGKGVGRFWGSNKGDTAFALNSFPRKGGPLEVPKTSKEGYLASCRPVSPPDTEQGPFGFVIPGIIRVNLGIRWCVGPYEDTEA